MKLTGLELRRIEMPLVAPFRTSFGTQTARDILLLHAVTDEADPRRPRRLSGRFPKFVGGSGG